MERTGAPHHEVSRFLLQATWQAGRVEFGERGRAHAGGWSRQEVADLVRRIMAEGTTGERYRRYATELLARLAVDVADAARSAEERTADRLLIGEMLRRLGRFDEAESHFAALANDLAPASDEVTVAAFQRRLVATNDVGLHSISEALGKSRQR